MRRLVVTENITLDGVIEMTEGWFDPGFDADNEDLLAEMRRQDATADALLVGRQTFEDFRGYWPQLTDDPTGISDYLNQVAKYVISSTLEDPQWPNSTVLSGPVREEVRALKEQPGQEIVATGSIRLVRELIAEGLVDEYRLFVYPVVVGHGERLFADATDVPRLTLLEARSFRSGVALLRYRAT